MEGTACLCNVIVWIESESGYFNWPAARGINKQKTSVESHASGNVRAALIPEGLPVPLSTYPLSQNAGRVSRRGTTYTNV